ncbi:4'-phosphopantetheinyl transferase family protein [Streptomyces puniciscabiei]
MPLPTRSTAPHREDPTTALYPQETAHLRHALPKRRREFATARVCARRALQALGLPPAPIPPGSNGAPQWPAGVVGSITHRRRYCAAAVALRATRSQHQVSTGKQKGLSSPELSPF